MLSNSRLPLSEPIKNTRGAKRSGPWLPCMLVLVLVSAAGCGTTRTSNTKRTATEQLLISDAVDRAVDQMSFEHLADCTIYFDPQYIRGTTDEGYIVSSFRQKLLASGCILKDKITDADYVVELRVGAVGTNSDGVVFGVPSVSVPPALAAVGGVPAGVPAIPEIPLIKRTDQKAVVKLGAFAYSRIDGKAYWQSRVQPVASTARDVWFFGAGPFQSGTIYDGTKFVGGALRVPTLSSEERVPEEIAVTKAALFNEAVQTQDGEVARATFEEEADKKPDKTEDTEAPKVSEKPETKAPTPIKPAATPSTKPAATPPTKPAATPPTKPAATLPTKPAATLPTKPAATLPTKPLPPPPTQPAAQAPAQPQPSIPPPAPPRRWIGSPSSQLRSTSESIITFQDSLLKKGS